MEEEVGLHPDRLQEGFVVVEQSLRTGTHLRQIMGEVRIEKFNVLEMKFDGATL